MSAENEDAVIAALSAMPGCIAINARSLGKAANIQSRDLFNAIFALRQAGKVEWNALRLTLDLRKKIEAEKAVEIASLADQVAEEAREAVAARDAAGKFGGVFQGGALRDGIESRQSALASGVQEAALADDPAYAAAMLRRAWAPLWERLCAQARASGQRPVELLVDAVERGL